MSSPSTFPSEVLTDRESVKLESLKETVRKGLTWFVDVGTALLTIRDERLYRATADTFEAFCQVEFGFSRRRANQLVQAAEVVKALPGPENGDSGTIVPIVAPSNEGQVRELAKVPEADRGKAWKEAVDTAPKDKSGKPKVTAAHVRTVVDSNIGKGGDRQGKAGKGTAAPPPPPAAADPLDEEGSSDTTEDDSPPKVTSSAGETGSAPETAASQPVAAADLAGNPIPTPVLAGIFADGQSHQGAALQLLVQASKLINPVVGKDGPPLPCGFFAVAERQHILTDLANLKTAIKQTRPYSVCPYCRGAGGKCQGCKGQGWVAESTYKAAPADYRRDLAATAVTAAADRGKPERAA